MIKLSLRCAAKYNQFGSAYGYGRTYNSFVKYLSRRNDIKLVDSYLDADMQVCMCYPHRRVEEFAWWGRRQHRVQVIYTTWETTVIPEDWADVMNDSTAVFAPSRWCCDVFRENGVKIPIYWTPNAADVEEFPFFERNWSGTECELWDGKKFVYLWQGMHPADRKGMIYAQRAFAELNLPDSWLMLKWYPVVSAPFGPIIYNSRRMTQVGRIFDRKLYMELLSKCHVSVNPFRGESPGQMPMETASTGMYTIATNWSGATDYLYPDFFWPLDYKLSKPGEDYISMSPYNDIRYANPGKAQDAIPDIEDLKRAMLWAYENREQAMAKGRLASAFIQKEWNWDVAAGMMVKACKKVMESV